MYSSHCGTAPASSRMYYSNTSINSCPVAVSCQSGYCTCIGSTRISNTTCAAGTSNCTLATQCIGLLTACLNEVADKQSAACPGLADLHMGLLAAESAGQWNTSATYSVCVYRTCVLLNMTAGNCMVNGAMLCPSPIKFVGTALFYGNFANVDLAVARGNIERDLAAFLGIPVRVLRLFLQALNRRQGGQSVLVIEFEVIGVNARNTALGTKLNHLRNSGGIAFNSFIEQYRAANNGALPIFIGVSAGVGSAAFSGTGIAGGIANGPTLPTSVPTNVPGGVTNAPGSQASSSSSTPGTDTSGTARQPLVAAAVVALLGALLI